ncbi:MAG: pantetheine-phosphate adenylyltransferase [Candidatus Riflebacteria bacterium]|nr:pantetheine-phosphate adenylyltransferase [Candidatus Riflebacteria bacterium]
MRIAVYPGSFDPFTYGHLDILERSLRLFDKVIVGVLLNPTKQCLLASSKRVELIKQAVADHDNVVVDQFNGLLIDYCKKVGACAVIRGLRVVSDYEYELQMTNINKQLAPDLETVFMMAASQYSFLSSSIVREVARYGGNLATMVSPATIEELKRCFETTWKIKENK